DDGQTAGHVLDQLVPAFSPGPGRIDQRHHADVHVLDIGDLSCLVPGAILQERMDGIPAGPDRQYPRSENLSDPRQEWQHWSHVIVPCAGRTNPADTSGTAETLQRTEGISL